MVPLPTDASLDPLALQAWRDTPVKVRLKVIARFREWLGQEAGTAARVALPAWRDDSEAARVEMLTAQVIPLADSCLFLCKKAAGILSERRNTGFLNPVWLRGVRSWVRREPLGGILIIGPGNYPLFLPGVQALQALVAGNGVFWKPAPGTTRAGEWFRELLQRAGLPAGLFRVLPEDPEVVAAVVEAGWVQKVICTGSGATGRAVMGLLARHAIPSVMELSGDDAVYVRADADLEMAARAVVWAVALNHGQTCIVPRRLFVAESVVAEFLQSLAENLQRKGLLLKNEEISTNVNASKVYLICGESSGVRSGGLVGGGEVGVVRGVFTQKLELSSVASDEDFLAKNAPNPAGLGVSIFTRDEFRARFLAERLPVGVVTVNDLIVPTADGRLPFPARRESGFGATRGVEGLLEMTVPKVVAVRRGASRPHLDPPAPGDDCFFEAYLAASCARGVSARWQAWCRFLRLARLRKTSDY